MDTDKFAWDTERFFQNSYTLHIYIQIISEDIFVRNLRLTGKVRIRNPSLGQGKI